MDASGNREFTGTFQFSRKVWADDFANDKNITFKDGFTLTIKKKTADIKISKGYTGYWSAFENHPESGTFINHYMVTVETTNGTKDPVTLTDTLNTNQSGISAGDYLKGGTYLKNSFKLYKEDASGTKTEILPFPDCKIQEDSNGNPQVVLDPLPALEIEEKYIWYYDVQRNYADFDKMPNGVGMIFNTATAKAGDREEKKAEAYYTCKTPRIEKNGQYDPKTGHIQWTITVKVPHSFLGSYLLQGCKITDALPDSVKIVGDVKVGNTTISAEKFRQNGYTIPESFTGTELTITFETTTPLGGGSVTNTAQIETKSKHTFEASDTVNIGQGAWTLSKQLSSSSKGLAKWDISAANAAGESSFTLVETLQDAVNESGQTQLDTHYAYAAELEKALEEGLTLTLHDGGTMNYAEAKDAGVITAVTYYSGADGTGGTVTANDPSTRVRSFTIQINKADGNPVRRVEVKDLPTHEDQSNVPTGEKWTYKNRVSVQGSSQSATAEDTYHSYKSFEKRVSANSDQDESGYQSGDQTYQYSDLSGNNLHYQLVVQTAAEDDADIVITDTLPENTEFNENWVTIGMDEGAPDKISELKGAAATVAYEKTTRQLTITIRDYNLSKNKQHKFRILYKVSVDDDPRWKNPSVGQVIYTNTAQWGELTETLHTTVEKTVDPLKKTGQLVDGKTDRIEYQVVVNPARKDLSVGTTKAPTIELWDDVKAQNGAIVRGDPESVKLYYFQYDDATNAVTRGDEVPRNLYQVLPADDEGWLHMVIPNQTAMILVYQCDVKQGSAAEDYNVDNTVKLGNGDSTESDSIKFTYASAATASTGQFLLHKVDDYSGVALQGAEFTIWQYDLQIKDWQPWSGGVNGVITTDEKGQVSLTVLENGGPQTLKPDVLYKIVETKAPQNYQGDDTPHYVLFHKSSETPRTAFDTATGKGTAMDGEKIIQFEDVQVGSAAQTTTAQYTNRYSNLTVSKLWLDQDTKKPVDPAAESIDIEVWRYTDSVESEEWFGKATLNKDNGWTFTWSGTDLPLTDEKGNAYHYLVKETTTGNWNVYISNNGVQTGNITVQNYVYTGYELPSTGGMGTAPFGMLGGALAAAAALLLVRKRKQNEEE